MSPTRRCRTSGSSACSFRSSHFRARTAAGHEPDLSKPPADDPLMRTPPPAAGDRPKAAANLAARLCAPGSVPTGSGAPLSGTPPAAGGTPTSLDGAAQRAAAMRLPLADNGPRSAGRRRQPVAALRPAEVRRQQADRLRPEAGQRRPLAVLRQHSAGLSRRPQRRRAQRRRLQGRRVRSLAAVLRAPDSTPKAPPLAAPTADRRRRPAVCRRNRFQSLVGSRSQLTAYPRTGRGEGDRHILLPGTAKLASPRRFSDRL